MIEIYYTGAGNKIREQEDPIKSLGGFISDSLVPNDFENALFGSVSGSKQELNDIIVLGLINTTEIQNGTITILDKFNSAVDYKGAAMAMILDTCGLYKTEKLPNRNGKPRGVQLVNIKSTNAFLTVEFDNSLPIGTLVQISDGATEVINTTTQTEDIVEELINSVEDGYYAIKEFDYEKEVYKLFVFKEDLVSFDAITNTAELTITETDFVSNQISIGNLAINSYVALYLQRDFKNFNKTVKLQNECSRLFKEFTNEVSTDSNREFSLRIEYDTP
jgi:hypothetical protein